MTTILPPQGSRLGRIIAVYGAHGGAGATTVAVNLADGLMGSGVRVLLVDASIQFGDVGTFLNLSPNSRLNELVENVDMADAAYIENAIATHVSGLKVLLAPPRPEHSEEISSQPDKMGILLGKLANEFDYIVVDMARHFDNLTITILDRANFIVLVTTPTLNAIKNAKLILELFKTVGYSSDNILPVVNRYEDTQPPRKYFLAADKIEKFLYLPLEARFPADEEAAIEAMARGISMMSLRKSALRVGKSFKDFADNIAKKQFPAARVPNPNPVRLPSVPSKSPQITVFLASATVEFVENVRKLLAFEQELKVVGTAHTGTEAIGSIKDLRPDVAIIDTNISKPDFITLSKEIAKLVPTTAVIVTSVNSDADTLRRAMLSGARDFLVKPIDADLLYNTIRNVDAQFKVTRQQFSGQPEQKTMFKDPPFPRK